MSYDLHAATMQNNLMIEQHNHNEDNTMMQEKRAINLAAVTTTTLNTPPSTTLELLGTILMKQKQLFARVMPEYGRFANTIFNTETLERIFQLSPLSKKRLMRKLMVKIVLGRIHHHNNNEDNVGRDQPVFQWAITGDSAAAGHGNSYAHSYASILQDTVEDLFHSAGINFVATNHAGDAWSGMELALCMESILFGRDDEVDVDVLSWDFTMPMNMVSYGDPLSPSQGIDPLLFGERAGRVLPHLPFLFFLGLPSDGGAWERVQKLETSGMGTNIVGAESLRELILSFPNYNRMSAAMAVNKFRCNGLIEGKEICNDSSQLFRCNSDEEGAQECVNAKYYDHETCSRNSRYQTSWNDGWKMHRLKGRLLGFHMVEMLRLAAVELDILERQHPHLRTHPLAALDALRSEEEVEEFLFSKTRPSKLHNNNNEGGITLLESWNILKQHNSICLNAKATAASIMKKSIRYRADDSLPQLEFDPPETALCEDFLPYQNVYFRINQEDGWVPIDPLRQQSIPENESVSAVGLCFKHCYGYQCGANTGSEMTDALIDWTKVEVQVDNNPVTDLKQVGGCYIIMHQGGSSSSDMKIRNQGESTLLLSSAFVLY